MKDLGLLVLLIWIILLCVCTAEEVNSGKPRTLSLLSLLPYPNPRGSGSDYAQPVWGDGPAVFLAAKLAVDIINNRTDILHGYKLELLRGDSGCNVVSKTSTALVENLFNKRGKQVLGIIGPGCSKAGLLVSNVISTNQRGISIPTIHLGGSPLFIAERQMFSLSFSMLDAPHTSADAILAVMQKNGWSNITILYDESHLYYSTIVEHFQQRHMKGLTIPIASVLYRGQIPFSQIRDSENRIILVLVGQNMLSQVLCITLRNGYVYPKYQFVLLNRILSDLRPVNALYNRREITCDLQEIFESAEQSIFLQYHNRLSSISPTMKLIDIGLTRMEFRQRYMKLIRRYNHRMNVDTEPSVWATFYFDSAWAMALALNNSQDELQSLGLDLAQFRYGQNQIIDAVHKQLTQLSFEGASGTIRFNSTTGFVSRGMDISQLRQGELKLLLYFNGSDLIPLSNKTRLLAIEENFDNYLTITKVPIPISILFMIFTAVILVLLASFHYISIMYRSFPSLKASDLKIIQMAYIGSYLTIAGIICESVAVVLDPRGKQCKLVHTSFLLVFCGMTLIFSTICSRTWRIYRIFIHFKNPGRFVSHRALFLFVCLCLTVELPAVLVWGFHYPIYPTPVKSLSMDLVRIHCSSETLKIWFLSLLSYNAIILFLSCYFALRCYKISQKNFKSNSVIILAYLLTIELTLGTGIYFLLPESDNPLQEYLAINVTLLVYISSCWVLLFMPPVLPLLKSDRRKRYNSLQCH